MATILAELCHQLVENTLGELSAHIWSALAQHNQLSVYGLALQTDLPLWRVKPCLATLIEQQLVLHHTADEDIPTYYQVDWRSAYNLARRTNVVSLVQERHGESAAQILTNVIQLGRARVGDLADAYHLDPGSKRDSGIDTIESPLGDDDLINGFEEADVPATFQFGKIATVSDFHASFRTLLQAGILAKVRPRSYMPKSDFQEHIEEIVISEHFPDRKITGPKKQSEFNREVNALKRKWREDDKYSDLRDLSSKGKIQRSGTINANPPKKRAKVNGDLPNGVNHETEESGVEESAPILSPDLVVRVDYSKCILAMRTQRLEQLANHHLGDVTCAVYSALLRCIERRLRGAREDAAPNADDSDDEESTEPTATVAEIEAMLDADIDLASSIKGASRQIPNGISKGKKRPHVIDEELDLDIKDELSDPDDDSKPNGCGPYENRSKRMSLIELHLALLEEHSKHFCRRARKGGSSNEWRIGFQPLVGHLIRHELDTTSTGRMDKIATRITRLLRQKGKLEDKAIASMCMMRVKDVLVILTHLQYQGVIDVQELPKDNARQPNRTLFLWFYDETRAREMLLQQTYKGMARALQRIPVEREKYRTAIKKADRTDVKGNEQEMLDSASKEQLRTWRETEERLLTQVDRMDDMVAVLRDFSGKDASLDS